MIEVEGLTKFYDGRPAVKGLSFRAGKGEILGFLGPNGAGKTTTMRMLTCYLPPTAGTARIAGHDILEESLAVRRRVGYLPENVPLYGDLTVAAYLDFVGRLKGLTRAQRIDRGGQLVEECGIEEVRSRPIGTLSRGFRQRVGLAQALLGDPEVLILDEPTVGLDPKQIIEIRDLIKGLAGERTIVLSTHILPEVSLVCQRVLIINNGILISDDTPDNLGRNLEGSNSVEITARGEYDAISTALVEVAGVQAVRQSESLPDGVVRLVVDWSGETDIREVVAAKLVSAGIGLLGMQTKNMSLEDVFVRLVTEEHTDARTEDGDPGGEQP